MLIHHIATLKKQRHIYVIGAAIIDLVMNAEKLPQSGDDVMLTKSDVHLGGCAFNVALTLNRLGISSDNLFPIGQGIWANQVKQLMQQYNMSSQLNSLDGDNGWCMALVEPNGERTFLTIDGVENHWSKKLLASISIEDNALIYLSGYQLAANYGEELISWLEQIPTNIELFIDLGPRITEIAQDRLNRLLKFKPILSLNRQEASHLGLNIADDNLKESVENFSESWFEQYQTPLIVRLDKDGVYCYSLDQQCWVDALPVNVVDSIGAGDSHSGAILAALSANWSLVNSLELANSVASYVVSHCGADCAPTIKELMTHLEQLHL